MKLTVNVKLQILFSKYNLIKYFSMLISFYLFFLVIYAVTLISLYSDVTNDYNTRLATIDKTEGTEFNLMCNVVSCKRLTYKLDDKGNMLTYVNDNNILKVSENKFPKDNIYFGFVNQNLETVIHYGDLTFYIDDFKYISLVFTLLVITNFLFTIIFTLVFIKTVLDRYHNELIEKNVYKADLETKLQRDITESIHHEMGMPIAIIDTLVTDLYANLYKCKYTDDGVCDFNNETVDKSLCKDCPLHSRKRETDTLAIEYYSRIKASIVKLNTILNLIAGSKHIKYGNGSYSAYMIIENVLAGINNFRVSKIKATYINQELMHKCAVGAPMNNGELMLVINNIITNSIEADTPEMIFEASMNPDGRLDIIVTDKGRGIRDGFDNIIADDIIFKYGYSTKDSKGIHMVSSSIIQKILYKLGFSVATTSSRGSGLSTNKGMLLNSGGDLVLLSTSYLGTSFKITIPTKERRNEQKT